MPPFVYSLNKYLLSTCWAPSIAVKKTDEEPAFMEHKSLLRTQTNSDKGLSLNKTGNEIENDCRGDCPANGLEIVVGLSFNERKVPHADTTGRAF